MLIPAQFRQLAAAQDGLATRRQALECGISIDDLRHAIGQGKRWQRVVTGVYATFTGPLQERHLVRAALLHAGPKPWSVVQWRAVLMACDMCRPTADCCCWYPDTFNVHQYRSPRSAAR